MRVLGMGVLGMGVLGRVGDGSVGGGRDWSVGRELEMGGLKMVLLGAPLR